MSPSLEEYYDVEWDELDTLKRSCKITLYRRELSTVVTWHWCLTFEWQDGYKASYEANNVHSNLTARWHRGGPDACGGPKLYDWHRWGTYRCKSCSPYAVNQYAKRIPIGGMKYNVLMRNCQDWAKRLAIQFGVILPPGAARVARQLVNPIGAFRYDAVVLGQRLKENPIGTIIDDLVGNPARMVVNTIGNAVDTLQAVVNPIENATGNDIENKQLVAQPRLLSGDVPILEIPVFRPVGSAFAQLTTWWR